MTNDDYYNNQKLKLTESEYGFQIKIMDSKLRSTNWMTFHSKESLDKIIQILIDDDKQHLAKKG